MAFRVSVGPATVESKGPRRLAACFVLSSIPNRFLGPPVMRNSLNPEQACGFIMVLYMFQHFTTH